MIAKLTAGIASLLAIGIGCAQDGGNLMPNPGTEEAIEAKNLTSSAGVTFSGNAPAFGWAIKKSSGVCEFGITEQERHSGNYSVFCKIKKRNEVGGFKFHIRLGEDIQPAGGKSIFRLKPATIYYFSFWCKAKGHLTAIPRYDEEEKDSGKPKMKYVGLRGMTIFPAEEWRKYETVFTTSCDMMKVIPIIQICSTDFSKAGDAIFIDDVEIIPFDEKFPDGCQ